jgi:hypothetical protein
MHDVKFSRLRPGLSYSRILPSAAYSSTRALLRDENISVRGKRGVRRSAEIVAAGTRCPPTGIFNNFLALQLNLMTIELAALVVETLPSASIRIECGIAYKPLPHNRITRFAVENDYRI